jgi:rare lipoprotein A
MVRRLEFYSAPFFGYLESMIWRTIVLSALLSSVTACSSVKPPATVPSQTGIASWYGVPFDGRPTASGEIFEKEKLTAAHRTLAFGSVVRVRNLLNSKTVEVRINDRGPFVNNRIIDLSEAAARNVDIPGTASVELQILTTPPHRDADNFAVQVAMLQDRVEASQLRQSLEAEYGTASLAFRDGAPPMWRVLVGMEPTEDAATQFASKLKEQKVPLFVVRIDPQ